jgi:hypothetical protein
VSHFKIWEIFSTEQPSSVKIKFHFLISVPFT